MRHLFNRAMMAETEKKSFNRAMMAETEKKSLMPLTKNR